MEDSFFKKGKHCGEARERNNSLSYGWLGESNPATLSDRDHPLLESLMSMRRNIPFHPVRFLPDRNLNLQLRTRGNLWAYSLEHMCCVYKHILCIRRAYGGWRMTAAGHCCWWCMLAGSTVSEPARTTNFRCGGVRVACSFTNGQIPSCETLHSALVHRHGDVEHKFHITMAIRTNSSMSLHANLGESVLYS